MNNFLLACLLFNAWALPQKPPSFDVLVVGATPAGIAAAINAAKQGRTVALVESSGRIGGLVTGGLSYTDFKSFEALSGTFRDYMRRVEKYYIEKYGADSPQVKDCFSGAHAEPHVSLRVFHQMLGEHPRIKVLLRHQLETVVLGSPSGGVPSIKSARFQQLPQREIVEIEARVFIDATYEGDLAAYAGVPYKVGRESTREYGERLAGLMYYDDGRILPGSTGEGDHRVQCYNFRLMMTRRSDNRVTIQKPAPYRREEFTPLLKHFKSGRIKHIFTESREGILRVQKIANDKADINDIKNAPIRLSLPGENYDYPDGSPAVRERIVERHRQYTLGLLYFLQNDSEIPEPIRTEAREWGFAKDEFEESEHFPSALYIREARRIVGEYVFKESDALMSTNSVRAPLHTDSIAVGDYSLNCHGEQSPGPLHPTITEGDYGYGTVPFQIPYGVIVPKRIANLLVPVAVSASHVGFSALRLEPTWTALGQAAGLAAHLSLQHNVPVNGVPVNKIQDLLHQNGAITVYFSDVDRSSPYFREAQYFGTRGFFHSLVDPRKVAYTNSRRRDGVLQYSYAMPQHEADIGQPIDAQMAQHWISLLPDVASRTRAGADPSLRPDRRLTRGAFLQRLFRDAKDSKENAARHKM